MSNTFLSSIKQPVQKISAVDRVKVIDPNSRMDKVSMNRPLDNNVLRIYDEHLSFLGIILMKKGRKLSIVIVH